MCGDTDGLGATAAIYIQVRKYDFVDLDDFILIHGNENLHAGPSPWTVWRSLAAVALARLVDSK